MYGEDEPMHDALLVEEGERRGQLGNVEAYSLLGERAEALQVD